VHNVVKGKSPRDGATKPKCVDKKLIYKLSKVTMEWLNNHSTSFFVSINMIGNGLFEVTFSIKEGEKHTLHNVFKM
jgi:hypothetical protein